MICSFPKSETPRENGEDSEKDSIEGLGKGLGKGLDVGDTETRSERTTEMFYCFFASSIGA